MCPVGHQNSVSALHSAEAGSSFFLPHRWPALEEEEGGTLCRAGLGPGDRLPAPTPWRPLPGWRGAGRWLPEGLVAVTVCSLLFLPHGCD